MKKSAALGNEKARMRQALNDDKAIERIQKQNKMTTFDILNEVALILRGEHPGWEGDSVWNAETYLNRFVNDFDNASEVATDIENNLNAASEVSGLSPNRCQWIVNRIRERL